MSRKRKMDGKVVRFPRLDLRDVADGFGAAMIESGIARGVAEQMALALRPPADWSGGFIVAVWGAAWDPERDGVRCSHAVVGIGVKSLDEAKAIIEILDDQEPLAMVRAVGFLADKAQREGK